MIIGIGVALLATAVGVDAVLFEMGYTKSTMRWVRSRTTKEPSVKL
jgi:hypothetical protein